jgi:hypothetical protein
LGFERVFDTSTSLSLSESEDEEEDEEEAESDISSLLKFPPTERRLASTSSALSVLSPELSTSSVSAAGRVSGCGIRPTRS